MIGREPMRVGCEHTNTEVYWILLRKSEKGIAHRVGGEKGGTHDYNHQK